MDDRTGNILLKNLSGENPGEPPWPARAKTAKSPAVSWAALGGQNGENSVGGASPVKKFAAPLLTSVTLLPT